jgi:hypothetical protein
MGNSCAQQLTGRARSSRHGSLDVVMADFPHLPLPEREMESTEGSRPWTVREVCGIGTLVARSAHRWSDPHTRIAGSRPAPAADPTSCGASSRRSRFSQNMHAPVDLGILGPPMTVRRRLWENLCLRLSRRLTNGRRSPVTTAPRRELGLAPTGSSHSSGNRPASERRLLLR